MVRASTIQQKYSLQQIEEVGTFGEMDEDEVSEENITSHAEQVEKMKNLVVPSLQGSSVTKITIPASYTKFKNAKPNPKTRLNVGKCLYL